MKELYVVRGTESAADTVWISGNYDVTWLHAHGSGTSHHNWRPRYADATSALCYVEFVEQTDIELEPEEYTKMRIEEVLP